MNIEKNRKKREEHIRKQQEQQYYSGKLIEENHNGYDYSYEFTRKAISWYLGNIYLKTIKYKNSPEQFSYFLHGFRQKLQTLLLHWSTNYPRDWTFWFIMDILDLLRNKKNVLEYCIRIFSSKEI